MAELVVRADPDGRPVPGMDLDVFIPVPDAETFATAAKEWLGALPALLAPQEWEEVLRNDKPPFSGKPETLWPGYDEWAGPFMAWGKITVAPLKGNGMRVLTRRVTVSNLEWLGEMLADRPVSAGITIWEAEARPSMPGTSLVRSSMPISVGLSAPLRISCRLNSANRQPCPHGA